MTPTTPIVRPARILPLIVLAQFFGTSLWFAGNAVLNDLIQSWSLAPSVIGWTTSAVQLGFIAGTLVSAVMMISDRFPANRLFMISATLGAVLNLVPVVLEGLWPLLIGRFLTGICLAGIYPVGMKLAAKWYKQGLGRALGYLVGALVLGTAAPHLVRSLGSGLPWQGVLMFVSALAFVGGVLVWLGVPLPPEHDEVGRPTLNIRGLKDVFDSREFRAAALGYIGHMWELYAFWTFVPVIIAAYMMHHQLNGDVSLLACLVIAVGSVGCVLGGRLSERFGSASVAVGMLFISGCCALLSPLLFVAPALVALPVMLIWGVTVVGDSAQFSTLTAQSAPSHAVGSALTVTTSMGFAITIVSIELMSAMQLVWPIRWVMLLLVVGPIFGVIVMWRAYRHSGVKTTL